MTDVVEQQDVEVTDESIEEQVPYRYSISSFGVDYPVDALVNRMDDEVIFVPRFQRSYVWPLTRASRFVESLLLGLPVPGIFLSKEPDTGRLLVIDGQQRLKTLKFFYEGIFEGREFKLTGVQSEFEGQSYKTLGQPDKRRLDDSVIHATIVRQEQPSDDQSSIFHIFERLNTGGMQLQAQEIRSCIFHGKFSELLKVMNDHGAWRTVFGRPHKRLKDRELILRFLALYFDLENYERPMKEFLNAFMGRNSDLVHYDARLLQSKFYPAVDVVAEALGARAFRPERALNASVFDSVMVGVARRLESGSTIDVSKFKTKYETLLGDEEYGNTWKTGTSDAPNVKRRMELATDAFGDA